MQINLDLVRMASAAGTEARTSRQQGAAAQDFEALLLTQLLRSAREAGGGSWMNSESDQASGTSLELGEEHLARALALQGGIGLAAGIQKALDARKKADDQPVAEVPQNRLLRGM